MSVHRYYFAGTEAPAVSPAKDAAWDNGSSVTRRVLRTSLGTEANTDVTCSPSGTQLLGRQYVGPVPRSGALTGTFTFVAGYRVNNANPSQQEQVRIHVWSADGLTKRGTLYAGDSSADTAIAQSASVFKSMLLTGNLTPVTAEIGDLLVVEIGTYTTSGGTSFDSAVYRTRCSSSSADLAATQGLTVTNENPWIELTVADIPNPRLRAAEVGAESLMDGDRLQVAEVGVEAMVFERTALHTVAGNPVYVKKSNGLWEKVWLHG